jgi:hypothetical protein
VYGRGSDTQSREKSARGSRGCPSMCPSDRRHRATVGDLRRQRAWGRAASGDSVRHHPTRRIGSPTPRRSWYHMGGSALSCLGDSTFDSRRLRRAQTAKDKKWLEFWSHLTGETGSDGEECGAAFSTSAGCRCDSCPTCPESLILSRLQPHGALPTSLLLTPFDTNASKMLCDSTPQ